jgi:hypothetical protein
MVLQGDGKGVAGGLMRPPGGTLCVCVCACVCVCVCVFVCVTVVLEWCSNGGAADGSQPELQSNGYGVTE